MTAYNKDRSQAKDRPRKSVECRSPHVSPDSECAKKGHDFRFKRFDRYGFCTRCGAETLT